MDFRDALLAQMNWDSSGLIPAVTAASIVIPGLSAWEFSKVLLNLEHVETSCWNRIELLAKINSIQDRGQMPLLI